MDWQFLVGLGLTIVLGLLPFAVKDMAQWVTVPGIAAGLLLCAWGLLPRREQLSIIPSLFVIGCIAGAIGGIVLLWQEWQQQTTGAINPVSDEKRELIKSVVQYTKMNRITEIMDALSLNIRVQMERQKHLATNPSIPFDYFQFGNQVLFRAREGNWGGRVITPGASLNALGAHEYPNEVSFVIRTPKMSQDGAQLKAFSDNLLLPPPIKWDLDEYINTWAQSEEAIADVLNDQAKRGICLAPKT